MRHITRTILCAVLVTTIAFSDAATTTDTKSTSSTASARKTTNTLIAPPRRDVPGKRFPVSIGQLYVPAHFDPQGSTGTDVVVFFHGAAWCSEQNFWDARRNAVLVSISVKNYGYPRVFRDPDMLMQVLDATTDTLAHETITSKPLGRLCLASFSGGYSAIREILKQPRYLPLITDVVLADSLYAPRIGKNKDKLDPAAMKPFVDYARRAAAGECTMWFSHLYPPKKEHRGNTTTLAANYLIDRTGLKRRPASDKNSAGAQLLYRADKGNLHILGYSGMTTQDHFNHFYALCDLLRQTSIPEAPSVP